MNLFKTLAMVGLLGVGMAYGEDVTISVAKNRDARFVATKGPEEPLKLIIEGKTVWSEMPTYGSPVGTEVSWSPWCSKAAVSIRGTKRTSSIRILDVCDQKKLLPIPNLAAAAIALNGGKSGRVLMMDPAGWADEDHVMIRVEGNLVDWGTDGFDDLNFCYIFLLEISTQRVVSVTCVSKHNLNCKELAGKTGS